MILVSLVGCFHDHQTQLEDPASLKKERDELRAAAAAMARQKVLNKIEKRGKDLEKWAKASKDPKDLFKSTTLESVSLSTIIKTSDMR